MRLLCVHVKRVILQPQMRLDLVHRSRTTAKKNQKQIYTTSEQMEVFISSGLNIVVEYL